MSRLVRVFSAIRHLARTRSSPRECQIDRPASFAEIVAASAFLDFGGMPSGDWLHAWEASVEPDRRLTNEERLPETVAPRGTPGNKYIDQSSEREKTIPDPCRPQHASCDFTGRAASLFRGRDGAPMLLIDKVTGASRMRPVSEPAALDLAMCVAAFGFVAGLLMFAHPALPTNRTANATAAEDAAAGSTQNATALSRLAAPR
jgi:hypothetical protein